MSNENQLIEKSASPDPWKGYTLMSCYRPDKPETIAFLYPMDHIIVYNRAAHPSAMVYDLCF